MILPQPSSASTGVNRNRFPAGLPRHVPLQLLEGHGIIDTESARRPFRRSLSRWAPVPKLAPHVAREGPDIGPLGAARRGR